MSLKKNSVLAPAPLVRISGTQLYRIENCQQYDWPVTSAARELRFARLVCRAAAEFVDKKRIKAASAEEKGALCSAVQAFKDCMADASQ